MGKTGTLPEHGMTSKVVRKHCDKAGVGRIRKDSAYRLYEEANNDLKKYRRCEGCPFGPSEVDVRIGKDEYKTVTIPAKCQFYDLKRKRCKITARVFSKKMREFKKFEPVERLKALAAFFERQLLSRAIGDEMGGFGPSKVQFDAMDRLKKIYQAIAEHESGGTTDDYEKEIKEIITQREGITQTVRQTKIKKKDDKKDPDKEEVEEDALPQKEEEIVA